MKKVIMESLLKKQLGCTRVKSFGYGGGGCISSGQSYETDNYGKVFVKINSESGARLMFDGELAGLNAIIATGTVRVPKPYKVVDHGSGAVLIMEHTDMQGLGSHAAKLGELLAKMHLYNEEMGKKNAEDASIVGSGDDGAYVSQFGFHTTTCCGYIPQVNDWQDDWVTFYAKKLEQQLNLLNKKSGDREANELWSNLQLKLPEMFQGLDIKPALLHGDLWSGNASGNKNGPLIFDPATFYGHHEYDLGIAGMFGGFGSSFYSAYHSLIPKQPGFNKRSQLYQLFHYLNHWNHFGSGYRGQSISIMKALVK
ncbi:ketosamine-3-kinase-like [Saccoglossus kowalevskii]|uniref:protein-ribulosamine 3-kinase n=1 Tax=Saccoglossus kowalevskii TaxID=10224 RepID=A0ABM0GY23_SACKO|nr:PREDICTED: ketosamine-3-kinase-like [Saccoglossus kowalevskii]